MQRWPRSLVVLSAMGVGLFQVVGSFGAADQQPERKALDALAVVLLLAGPMALAWRDRRPLVAVAVSMAAVDIYVGLGYPYGPIFLSVVVALYSAVQAGQRRATWLVAGVGYVGYVVASLLDPRSDEGQGVVHLALVAGWLLGVLAVSELVRSQRAQTASRARTDQEARERRAAEQRLLLAQELHDVLAHNISLINVQAGVALHLLDEQPEQARPALATIKAASRDALQELRAALDVLRRGEAAPRTPSPRLADLDSLVAGMRASGLEVTLQREDLPERLDVAVELAAYRIVQEALTNVTRHARARRVTVRCWYDGGVWLEVRDDGVGGVVHDGNGIAGMRERASALAGTVVAGPVDGGGFRVLAHLPGHPG